MGFVHWLNAHVHIFIHIWFFVFNMLHIHSTWHWCYYVLFLATLPNQRIGTMFWMQWNARIRTSDVWWWNWLGSFAPWRLVWWDSSNYDRKDATHPRDFRRMIHLYIQSHHLARIFVMKCRRSLPLGLLFKSASFGTPMIAVMYSQHCTAAHSSQETFLKAWPTFF